MIPWNFSKCFPKAGGWSLEESDRFCLRCAISHYENFPVIAGIFDEGARKTLAAVYSFARFADDFADEPEFEGVRLHLLDDWENQLEKCIDGNSSNHPVFISLKTAIERHRIDPQLLRMLLSAFKQDCTKNRYETMEEVLDYCRRSANPVGRIVLRVFNRDTPENLIFSDWTCTSLQLINFWQDISVDRKRNRLYIPREISSKYGVDSESIVEGKVGIGFQKLMEELVSFTGQLMRRAEPLPELVGFPWDFYLRAVQKGGLKVLRKVKAMGVRILNERPSLSIFNMGAIFIAGATDSLARVAYEKGSRSAGKLMNKLEKL